jgi:hypothetical protein
MIEASLCSPAAAMSKISRGRYAGAAMMNFFGDDLRDRFKQNGFAFNGGLYRWRRSQCGGHDEVDLPNPFERKFSKSGTVALHT